MPSWMEGTEEKEMNEKKGKEIDASERTKRKLRGRDETHSNDPVFFYYEL